MKEEAEK
jgi:thiamine kinase-like enzyme